MGVIESDGTFLYLAGQPLTGVQPPVRLISFDPIRGGPVSSLELPNLTDAKVLALEESAGATTLLIASSDARAALVRADSNGSLERLDDADFSDVFGGRPLLAGNFLLDQEMFVLASTDLLLFLPLDHRLRIAYTATIRPPGAITDLDNVTARYGAFDRGPLGLIEGGYLRPVPVPGPNAAVDLAAAAKMLGGVFRLDRATNGLYFFLDGERRYYYAYITNTNVRQPFFDADLGGVGYDLATHDPTSRQIAFLVQDGQEQKLVLGGGVTELGFSFSTLGIGATVARPFVSLFPTHLASPQDRIHVRIETPEVAGSMEPTLRVLLPSGVSSDGVELLQHRTTSPPTRSFGTVEWEIDPATIGEPIFTLEVSYPLTDGSLVSDSQEYILPWLFPATN